MACHHAPPWEAGSPMPVLTIDDLTPERFDTVIVAGADMQGRLFGRRLPLRRFLAGPVAAVDICTCVFVWDIADELGAHIPFAGPQTGWSDLALAPDQSTLR